jgi:hypothetical protein
MKINLGLGMTSLPVRAAAGGAPAWSPADEAGLSVSAKPYGAQEPAEHFAEVLTAMGLQRIEETPP